MDPEVRHPPQTRRQAADFACLAEPISRPGPLSLASLPYTSSSAYPPSPTRNSNSKPQLPPSPRQDRPFAHSHHHASLSLPRSTNSSFPLTHRQGMRDSISSLAGSLLPSFVLAVGGREVKNYHPLALASSSEDEEVSSAVPIPPPAPKLAATATPKFVFPPPKVPLHSSGPPIPGSVARESLGEEDLFSLGDVTEDEG